MPTYRTTEWIATCPRCTMNVSQDYYPCSNCTYRPLTLEYNPPVRVLSGDLGTSSFRCMNCNNYNGRIKCPNTDCGTDLTGVVHAKKKMSSSNASINRILIWFWIVFAILAVITFLAMA